MSALWQQCCKECGENECSVMCSEPWKSSYVLMNLSGDYSYSKTHTITPSCLCTGQGVQSFRRNWNVQVTWTQTLPVVITRTTRPDGSCCYYGTGEVTVDVTVEVEELLLCCDSPYTVTTATQTFERLDIGVPICVSLVCEDNVTPCTNIGSGRKFSLNVCMCDFPLQESVTLNAAVPAVGDQCTNQLQAEPECGWVMGGFCWYYEAQLVEPRTLTAGQRTHGSVCSSQLPCSTVPGTETAAGGDDQGCMPCVREAQAAFSHGPFAIYCVEPFTLGVDDPGTCSCPQGNPIIGPVKALTDCGDNGGSQCAPCIGYSFDADCCSAIIGSNITWPVFI